MSIDSSVRADEDSEFVEPQLSGILDRFSPSAIARIFDQAVRLKEAGHDLADFSTGEPDFDTPDHIKAAGKKAIDEGDTKYTALVGTSALKTAIQYKFKRDNDLDYALDEIIVSSGAKPLLAYAFMTMLDPGDEVVVPAPCWPSHPGAVNLVGGTPVFVHSGIEQDFKITPAQLEAAISPKTKAVILCSPSNPTGSAYRQDEIKALADVLLRHEHVWILTDDLYEHIVFGNFSFSTIAAVEPRLKDRTLTVNGVSKAYAMTGWRIGFAGGPKRLISGIAKVFSQSFGSSPAMSQAAAVEALEGPQDFLPEYAKAYERRRDIAIEGLSEAPGLKCNRPEGAFYLFPWCEGVLGKITQKGRRIEDAVDFVEYLLEDWGVVVVPGEAFEAPGYFRMSIAVSDDTLRKGVGRIVDACKALQ